jgi:hypothetical protein
MLAAPVHRAGQGIILAAVPMPDGSGDVGPAEAFTAPDPLADDARLYVVFGAGQVGRVLAAVLAGRGLNVRVLSRHRPPELPVVVIAAGHSDWVLPSIVITIGPLLLYLDHLVHIPRYRLVGWALTAGPVILVATMSGKSLAVTTGFAAGVVLLGTATAGFHDLARLRPARLSSPAGLTAKFR